MRGWIKLHRELFESDIWNDVSTFRLFLYLISQASHKDGVKTKGIEIKRGQYIRSYRKLADDLSYKEGRGYKKYSLSTIKSCVNKLIEAERVNVKETEVGTLFTIVNYAKYQDLEEEEKETPNTINEEVRTNTELTPNEVRTNSEQEQELKNLRIKELNLSTTTTVDDDLSKLVTIFNGNICPLSPLQVESLEAWFQDFHNNFEIIMEAIKIAADRNKKSYGFVEYLLRDWANNNLADIEQVKTYERNKFNNKSKPAWKGRSVREEKVPSWFKEQKTNQKVGSSEPIDIAAERERLKRELGG